MRLHLKLTNEMIDALNRLGSLTVPYLMCHFKVSPNQARVILASIVESYENVRYNSKDRIYIEEDEDYNEQLKLAEKLLEKNWELMQRLSKE